MPKPIRLAFIGLGPHSFYLAKYAAKSSSIKIQAGFSIDRDNTEQFAEAFSCAAIHDFETLCADSDIDAVVVASPNHVHAEQSIALTEHGKHIFVEKPIANTINDTDAIIEATEKHQVKLAVGHHLRRMCVYRKMKQMINADELGEIYSFEANHCGDLLNCWSQDDWRFKNNYGVGPIMHKGIHKIDVLNYLFGAAESVSTLSKALSFNQDMSETTITGIKYSSGTVGSLSTGFRYNNQTFNIYGEHLSLFYSGYGNTFEVKNEKTWERYQVTCEDVCPITEELNEFALAIQDNTPIEVGGREAREAVILALAAAKSDQENRPVHILDILETCCA